MSIPWNRLAVVGVLVAGLTGAGCVEQLPAEGQPCPCAKGYYCSSAGAGEPGLCWRGDPKDECLQPRVIDRFDDGLLTDWTESSKEISIVDGRLLAQRRESTALGNAVRKIELAPGRFALEVAVELKTTSSWIRATIGTATGDVAYTMVLSNNAQDKNRTGFYLLGSTDYGINNQTSQKDLLVEKEFVPEQGRIYNLRLSVDPEGKAELFLDGERIGTAMVDKPTVAMTRVQLGGGQNSDADHGGYFDNLVVRGCPLPKPTFVPDKAANPVADVYLSHVHHDGTVYRGYQIVKGNETPQGEYAPDTISVYTSQDGAVWALETKDALGGEHTAQSKYITQVAATTTKDGKLMLYITAGSNGCHQLNKIYLSESSDGVGWTFVESVLEHGPISTFDSRGVYITDVLRAADGKYRLFYESVLTHTFDNEKMCALTELDHVRTGLAYLTSDDGVSWQRQGLAFAIGLAEDKDGGRISSAQVWRSGQKWKLVYRGESEKDKTQGLHYATSPDGMSWTKHGEIFPDVLPVGLVQQQGAIELFYSCGTGTCRASLKDPS